MMISSRMIWPSMACGIDCPHEDVQISNNAAVAGDPSKLHIGKNVRIDDFCLFVVVKDIYLENNCHVGPYCYLNSSGGGIFLSDGVALSARCSVYTSSDDYRYIGKKGPQWPEEDKKSVKQGVFMGDNVVIGAHSVILPGANIQSNVSVAALSLVPHMTLITGYFYKGVPVEIIKPLIEVDETEEDTNDIPF